MAKTGDIFPSKDPIKKSLFIPKLLLESTNFWPEKRNFLTKTTNWIMLAICLFIEIGQISFAVANFKNITTIASAMSTISTTFQALTKLTVLYIHNKKLKKVLHSIWYDFWPASVAKPKTALKLEIYNRFIIVSSLSVITSASIFAFGFLSSPLRTGNKVLPFESVYPFDLTQSPLYEIIYVIEWMTNIAFIIVGICGHDFLFLGVCSNIVGQYVILTEILHNLGTENVHQINIQLEDLTNINIKPNVEDQNTKLLRLCIHHHSVLTEVSKEISQVFSFSSFVQLFSSVTALCVAALIITFADIDISLFTTVTMYLLGHLMQLFLFCTLGNEADEFASSIFSSQWYNVYDDEMRKDLVFVIKRAQRKVKMTAMGVKVLDYQTFIWVLRLSFSFYTMLSKVTDNN